MMRLAPKSLFGQTLTILVAGLLFSLILGSWIYSLDRGLAVRAVGGFALAQRIANVARLVEEIPPDWRERITTGISDQAFHVTLGSQAPVFDQTESDTAVSQAISDFLIEQLSLQSGRRPLVAATTGRMPTGRGYAMGQRLGPMMHGMDPSGFLGGFGTLQVAVPLANGQWLAFATALPQSGPGFSLQFLLSMVIMAVAVLSASAWAVRRVQGAHSSLLPWGAIGQPETEDQIAERRLRASLPAVRVSYIVHCKLPYVPVLINNRRPKEHCTFSRLSDCEIRALRT